MNDLNKCYYLIMCFVYDKLVRLFINGNSYAANKVSCIEKFAKWLRVFATPSYEGLVADIFTKH